MTVSDICKIINGSVLSGREGLNNEVTGVYICDLLSWVMSHGVQGNAWITVQTHSNVVAVATLLELSCIIVPEDIDVDKDTLLRAEQENIPIISCSQNAYEIAKKLYNAGIGN